ncbi:MAG: hypothetical protein RH917_04930 [Lacipirellulaceae bacterium]
MRGYQSLEPAKYKEEQETAITGDLVGSIETVLEESSESWMRFFRVYDDPPINDSRSRENPEGIRKGRSRRRIDIKIDSSEFSPYSRFYFEAKRLGKRHPVGGYVGKDGLSLFLTGDYAAEEYRAGMLGYVQKDDESVWAERIESKLSEDEGRFRLTSDGSWTSSQQCPELQDTYVTCHSRDSRQGRIRIYHSLLKFY